MDTIDIKKIKPYVEKKKINVILYPLNKTG